MSEMAKQARQAMKAKASRLTTADPHQKVDSSTWTPPEPLNTEVKTGLRPISRRAFKKGGKVMGAAAKTNLGKATRGGNKPITPNNFANKDVKAANEDRMGLKHVGGLKTGGRAKKNMGGAESMPLPVPRPKNLDAKPPVDKKKVSPGDASSRDLNRMMDIQRQEEADERCYGGKTKKRATGGPVAGAEEMMKKAQQTSGVPSATLGFTGIKKGTLSPMRATGMKKGGMAHEDVKADMALIKKMVKPSAMKRKGRDDGGRAADFGDENAVPNPNRPKETNLGNLYGVPMDRIVNRRDTSNFEMKRGGKAKRAARKEGGGVFSGESYPGKIPGVVPGGRTARATGGKAKKGKTNINIVIAAGKPAGGADMMNPMGGPTRPPGMGDGQGGVAPVPVPPAGGAPQGMPMPMPIPMPMPAAGGAPAPRKSGGRLTAKASSYKDMTAGAGSGEGRLQKTDIAKARMGRKAGGKTYRSYKDMDAGAGSGMGRLEKTEIQAHKR